MSNALSADEILRVQAMEMAVKLCLKDFDQDAVLLAQAIYKYFKGEANE